MHDERRGLFNKMLYEVYAAETELAHKLQAIAATAVSFQLVDLIERIRSDSQTRIVRLESITAMLDQSVDKAPWSAVSSLLSDALEAAEFNDTAERETAIALSLASVMHLQVVRYNTLQQWSSRRGLHETSVQLRHSLAEEIELARLFTAHAQTVVLPPFELAHAGRSH